MPIVCYTLKERDDRSWTLYDLSDRLLMRGWQVPSYPLPANLDTVVIQRVVCRADLGKDMAEQLVTDIKEAIQVLEEQKWKGEREIKAYGFTH